MNQKSVHMSTWPLVRRLWHDYIHNYKSRLFAAMGLMVVIAACTAGFAKLIEPILNQIFIGKNQAALWPVGIAVLLVFAIRGCANYGEEVLMSSIGQSIVRDLQDTMFRHIIHMDLAFFQSAPIGTLISRFTFDVNNLRHATSTAITGMGKSVMTIIFLVGLLFYQDPFLATLSVFIFPLTFYPIVKLGKRMRKVAVVTQGTAGFYTSLLEQIFNGIRHVKAYHAEVREIFRAENMTQTLYRLTQKSQRVRALGSPIMEIFGAIAIFIIIIYGGHQVISGQKSAGEFFSFITALLLAYEPLKDLSKLNAGLQEGLASAQRIYTLLALAPELQEAKDAKELKLQKGEIKFTNVEFVYDTGVEALRGINLVIPAGKTVALVGTSGSGKTTILNMIPRFYDVKNGAITIDQQDVRELTFKSLREKIALVSQETILFDDTIKANIAYGRPSASMDDIVAAAKNAGAHDFIMNLPLGYDAIVGAHGTKLSGGQRQRVSIARAMLKNAPILLLDEATSALDTETERQVQAALKLLMQGRTVVVVAHRLSTIVDADLIYVISEGRVLESGTHGELLARGGHYAKLYDMQFTEPAEIVPLAMNS